MAGYAVALAGLMLVIAATAQNNSPDFAKFKSEMMPKVGQKITVVGTLHDGKQGLWLAFNNWGVYIYAAKESGLARENDLYAHFRTGRTVKVTGTLRHTAEPLGTGKDKQGRYMQIEPEHFFFDAAEVRMSLWSSPTPTNPNQ
jgi:hypothetical protein